MNTTATIPALSIKEIRLIAALDIHELTEIKRRSDHPFDLELSGERLISDIPSKFSGWLPLMAIAEADWDNSRIANLSDYPDLVMNGDWSGIRDSNENAQWTIFFWLEARRRLAHQRR